MKELNLDNLPPELEYWKKDFKDFEEYRSKKDFFILDENHNVIPANLMEWGKFLEQRDKRRVAKDRIDGKKISTVFIGVDHNFSWDDGDESEYKPHIFETMVFDENGDEMYCARCSTWNEAEEQHQIAVQWVKDGCVDED